VSPPRAEPERGSAAAGLGEFGRIERFLRPLAARFPGALDLTDDAAVIAVPAGQELVMTTDAMVAGVHFLANDPPGDIAAKLLRVNLSDLAAKAADPLAYMLSMALPAALGDDWLEAFAAGLAADQERYGITLVGGDSVATPGPVALSVTALGLVPRGRAVLRRTARPDDRVFVTGTIGDAALGLDVVLGRLEVGDQAARQALVERLRRPEPRTALIPLLRRSAAAAIDVSDGLVADLGHIGETSGCAAVLHAAGVPLSAAARSTLAAHPELLNRVLTGGDDYEIVFTAPAEEAAQLRDEGARLGVPVSEIGHLCEGPAGAVRVEDAAGREMKLVGRGWTHF
jgi:thiamine-monophosphate kinase